MCSTPVGVKDRFTPPSSNFSTIFFRCSTPVGVKDRFTPRLTLSGPVSQVLNACRRQRSVHLRRSKAVLIWNGYSTPVGVKDRFTLLLESIRSSLGCAQRLSASKIGSRQLERLFQDLQFVLNACRRQRSVHVWYLPGTGLPTDVLNACRRQRSVH